MEDHSAVVVSRMPDVQIKMVECMGYLEWFHIGCQTIPDAIERGNNCILFSSLLKRF